MEGHRILRSIQDFRNLSKTSDSSGSWRIQAATVCRARRIKDLGGRAPGSGRTAANPSSCLSELPNQEGETRFPGAGMCLRSSGSPAPFWPAPLLYKGAMEKAGKPALNNPSARTRKGITDMGIFVNLAISTSDTQDEWTSVYEESLRGNKRSSDPRKTGSKRPESASRAGSLPRDPLTQWGRK